MNTIWCITIDCHSPFRHTSWVIHTSGHVLTIDVGRCLLKLDHVKRFSVLWLVLFKGRSLKRVRYCLQCLFSGILSWFFLRCFIVTSCFFLGSYLREECFMSLYSMGILIWRQCIKLHGQMGSISNFVIFYIHSGLFTVL